MTLEGLKRCKRMIGFVIFEIIFVYNIFFIDQMFDMAVNRRRVSFLIVLLNKQTLSFISKLTKDFFQGNPLMALLIWSVFAFLKCHTSRSWWIVEFEIKFSKYYLMMAVLVKRRVDTRTHYQIWLKGEDKIDTGHRCVLNVSRFINNLL